MNPAATKKPGKGLDATLDRVRQGERVVLRRGRRAVAAVVSMEVRIADGGVEGNIPPRALGHEMEWWSLHREELAENWRLAQEGRGLKAIEPLE